MREGKRFRMVGYINQFTVPNALISLHPVFFIRNVCDVTSKNQLKEKSPIIEGIPTSIHSQIK